jgi:hypothetical protein
VAVAEFTNSVAATITHVGVPAVLWTNDTVIATVKYVNAIVHASPFVSNVPLGT